MSLGRQWSSTAVSHSNARSWARPAGVTRLLRSCIRWRTGKWDSNARSFHLLCAVDPCENVHLDARPCAPRHDSIFRFMPGFRRAIFVLTAKRCARRDQPYTNTRILLRKVSNLACVSLGRWATDMYRARASTGTVRFIFCALELGRVYATAGEYPPRDYVYLFGD